MRKRQPTAPRTAHRQSSKQSREDREARVRELTEVATRGETPEEIIAKGLAIQEIKRLKPWKDEGLKGGFGSWAKIHLPYRAARANQYIRIATNLTLEQVAGSNLCFEALLQIARAAAHMRMQLIKDAMAGTPIKALRRIVAPAHVQTPQAPDPLMARAERVQRLQDELIMEAQELTAQVQQGVTLPPEVLDRISAKEAVLKQLIEGLCGRPPEAADPRGPADPQGPQGPEMDPRGSTPGPAGGPPAQQGPTPHEGPSAPVPTVPTDSTASTVRARTGVDLMGTALQLPAEVVSFRPLFRFFHEELTPGRQDAVVRTLVAVIQGDDRTYWLREMHRSLRPFLPDCHPMKKDLGRFAVGLRAAGTAGRRFALYCLLLARLPGLGERLEQLARKDLPGGLGEMVRYYRNLILCLS